MLNRITVKAQLAVLSFLSFFVVSTLGVISYINNKQSENIVQRIIAIGEIQHLASETSADLRGFRLFLKQKFLDKFKKDTKNQVKKNQRIIKNHRERKEP